MHWCNLGCIILWLYERTTVMQIITVSTMLTSLSNTQNDACWVASMHSYSACGMILRSLIHICQQSWSSVDLTSVDTLRKNSNFEIDSHFLYFHNSINSYNNNLKTKQTEKQYFLPFTTSPLINICPGRASCNSRTPINCKSLALSLLSESRKIITLQQSHLPVLP